MQATNTFYYYFRDGLKMIINSERKGNSSETSKNLR